MPDHPKILPLSDNAFRTLIEMTLWSRANQTDGFIPAPVAKVKWKPKAVRELTSNDPDEPSLERVDGGFQVHDYEEYQQTRAEVEGVKAKNQANGKRGGRPTGYRKETQPVTDSVTETVTKSVTESVTEKKPSGLRSGLANENPTGNPNETESITETKPEKEKEKEKDLTTPIGVVGGVGDPLRGPTPQKTKTQRRANTTRMPEDWAPNPAHRAIVDNFNDLQTPGWGLDMATEVEAFKAWTTAKDAKFANWDAAFRNHLVGSKKRGAYRLPDPFTRPSGFHPTMPTPEPEPCPVHGWGYAAGHCAGCAADHRAGEHRDHPSTACHMCEQEEHQK
jgi:hypothetical protein